MMKNAMKLIYNATCTGIGLGPRRRLFQLLSKKQRHLFVQHWMKV